MTMDRIIEATCRLILCAALSITVAATAAAPARAQNAPAAGAAGAQDEKLSEAQIEQLVAPIALYPDNLLSQILMASTYPLEVVEAARWSHDNAGIMGQALEDTMQKQSWDPSVKALTAVPQTLRMMNDKLDWTQQLGDAFLAQQQDVLDAVQKLRARADAAGSLKTTPQQKVTKASPPVGTPAPAGLAQVISIEPADPDVYYVPVYDPGVVYGVWPLPDYPPFTWYPSGWAAANVFSFAAGVTVGVAIWAGVDWWRRNVNINVDRFNQFNHTRIASTTWTHDPGHRRNVPYRNVSVAERFQQADRNVTPDTVPNRATNPNRTRKGGRGNSAGRNAAANRAANLNRTGKGGRGNQVARSPRGGKNVRGTQVNRAKTGVNRNATHGQAIRPAGALQRGGGGRRR